MAKWIDKEYLERNLQNFKNKFIDSTYSTEEKKIGKWINNSVLYRKIITLNSADTTVGNSQTVVSSFKGNVVNLGGVVKNNKDGKCDSVSGISMNGEGYLTWTFTPHVSSAIFTATIIVEYTKN